MTGVLTEEIEDIYQRTLADAKWNIHYDYTDISGAVRAVVRFIPKGSRLTWQEYKPVAVRLIRDLIDAGVRPGDLTVDGIEPWPVSPAEAKDRIVGELMAREDWPNVNEIAWLDLKEDPGPPEAASEPPA